MPIALAAPLLSAALTLRVPFAPDGSVAGCPHAHALRMALELKGVPYDIAPLDSAALPCSLEASGGDALDIAALDAMHPEPPLRTAAAASACSAAASLLSAIERYLLSTADVERAHKQDLLRSLCSLDALLARADGPHAAGADFTFADCALLTAIYHLNVAGKALKGFDIPPQFDALEAYRARGFENQLLYRTASLPAAVRWRWAVLAGNDALAQQAADELRARMPQS